MSDQLSPPQWSDDGLWWWTGTEWVGAADQPQAQGGQDGDGEETDNPMPGQSLPTPVLMTLVGVMVVVVFAIFAMFWTQANDDAAGTAVCEALQESLGESC